MKILPGKNTNFLQKLKQLKINYYYFLIIITNFFY